ncbi:pyridoxal phosphate-dependent aminotransferase [Massilia sp. W12]|uniref:pyridoxal phosphate-dependent aminotransferase n=1 Tax=Massilia sp. W12 TaxID=3126507 RepID=UPI0030CD2BF2
MPASRLAHIAPFHVMEILKRAQAMQAAGRDMISMSIGEPDFGAPPPVVAAAAEAMAQGRLQYTNALGLPALRQALSQHYADNFGLDVPAQRIVLTAGASGALLLACAALVEPGAQVIMPDPCYPCNRHFVAAFNGRAQLLPCGPEQGFQPRAAQIEQAWADDSAGVLLATPSNPTGTSIAQDELAQILALCQARGGFAIIDEIYQGLRYTGAPHSALALSDQVTVINSFSKYFHMTGWRLGWMVVPEDLLEAVERLAQNLFICPSAIAQYAALACFTPEAQAIYRARKEEFAQRRSYILGAMRELGFVIPQEPDGAFYVYADCRRFLGARWPDADALCNALLEETGVVLTPGKDFGPATASDYLRLSYATALPRMREAVQRMQRFFQQHGML